MVRDSCFEQLRLEERWIQNAWGCFEGMLLKGEAGQHFAIGVVETSAARLAGVRQHLGRKLEHLEPRMTTAH